MLSIPGKELWTAFKIVVKGFLGQHRDPHYQKHIKQLKRKMRKYKIKMTLKIHILLDHVDKFPASNSDFSDEAGERCHQDIKESVRRTKNKPLKSFLVDYVWRLMQQQIGLQDSQALNVILNRLTLPY